MAERPATTPHPVGRIAFATNNGDIGGGEVMLFALARAARDLGVTVTVVGPTEPGAVVERAHAEGFDSVALEAADRLNYLKRLRAWDATERAGLLWCNGLVPAVATAGHRARVVHLHQLPTLPHRVAARLAGLGARVSLVPSDYLRRSLPGARVLPNWTAPLPPALPRGRASDTDTAEPAAEPAAQPVTLGFLGRQSSDKGVPVLAAALAELDRRRPGGYRLVLAGAPRFVSDADQRAVAAALVPVDHLVDRVGWIAPADFFAAVDLAVFPSVRGESFGLVAAEAMSAPCPFVISDAGALPEVAGPDHPWIARAGDAASLADTIERALAEAQPEHLAAARHRWQEEFSPDAGRRRLAALLAELAEPKAPRRMPSLRTGRRVR